MVTRAAYETVYTLYVWYNWTGPMIERMVDLKPWEVAALIEGIEKNDPQVGHEVIHTNGRVKEAA